MARHHDLPPDPIAAEELSARGLRYALVDPEDPAAFAPFQRAVARGFHGADPTPENVEQARTEGMILRRHSAVFDDGIAHPEFPVGTVNSWPTELAIPGARTIEAWAISSVSVAPTHRRRGIARSLLEAELRTAQAHGTPIAMLTVSESGIYGRFGFAPAASAATWVFETRRVTWTGPTPAGRVEFITTEEYLDQAAALHAETLAERPGEIAMWPGRWQQRAGTFADDASLARKTRAVRYLDDAGAVRGVAVYRVGDSGEDFTAHDLEVVHLWAPHPDAHAALWRFLLDQDLVSTVTARLMRPDDPVRWSIGDWRAATVTVLDHQYLRILDVAAAFGARGYDAAGELVVEVDDVQGFAAGTWLLRVADGVGRVEPVETPPDGIPVLAVDVGALSALYLGGVRALDLVQAGRASEHTPGAARVADALLHSLVEPSLGGWY